MSTKRDSGFKRSRAPRPQLPTQNVVLMVVDPQGIVLVAGLLAADMYVFLPLAISDAADMYVLVALEASDAAMYVFVLAAVSAAVDMYVFVLGAISGAEDQHSVLVPALLPAASGADDIQVFVLISSPAPKLMLGVSWPFRGDASRLLLVAPFDDAEAVWAWPTFDVDNLQLSESGTSFVPPPSSCIIHAFWPGALPRMVAK